MRRSLAIALVATAAVATIATTGYVALLRGEEAEEPQLSFAFRSDSIRVGERERSFVYGAPALPGPRPTLVLAFHGAGGDWRQMRRLTGYQLDRLAERHGFIIAYPNGVEGHWNDCRARATYSAKRQRVDDVAFTRALIRYFRDLYGVDSSRVFALGFSNGGHMALRLALEAPRDVRAVAAIAASLPTRDNLDCAPAGVAVPTMLVNGTEDRINPYTGGLSRPIGRRAFGGVESVEGTADYFARLAGHTRFPLVTNFPDADSADGSRVDISVWREAGLAEVQLLTVHGGGHTLPSRTVRLPRILGTTNRDVDGVDAIWSFFARQMAPHLGDFRDADPARHHEVP